MTHPGGTGAGLRSVVCEAAFLVSDGLEQFLTFSVTERPETRRANVRLGALRGQEISLAIIADVKYFGACPGYFTFCGSGFQTRALHTLSRHSVTTCHQAALQPITILWFRKLIFS